MNGRRRHPIWTWVIHTPWVLAVLAILGVMIFFGSGAGNPIIQRLLIARLESAIGGRVEFRSLSIRWLSMRVILKHLVIHGSEPAGSEPFFSADQVQAALGIDSFWGRRVSLNELLVQQPNIHIVVGKNGATNVPSPQRAASSKRPWNDTLFQLRIHQLLFSDGWVLFNDTKVPLTVHGGDLRFSLDGGGTKERPLYLGNLEWQTVEFNSKHYVPLPVGVTAKFSLGRDGFALEQGVFSAGHSRVDAHAEMNDFVDPKWTFRYRGWLELADIRDTLRDPNVPAGRVDLHGEGQWSKNQLQGTGNYSSQDIALPYEIFHAKGLISRGTYHMDKAGLEIPDFFAGAFGGSVTGRVDLVWDGLKFRAQTHVAGMKLAPILPCIEHRNFPVDELHWDSRISADSVETWTGPFRHFEILAKTAWEYPDQPAEHHQPVRASWQLHYRFDARTLLISPGGEFDTPSSHGTVDGLLAPHNSALNIKFEAQALEPYKDFINGVRDATPAEAAQPMSGTVKWDGKINGPSSGATFQGHARGEKARYDGVLLDSFEGDLTYSPSQLILANGTARRGQMQAAIEANLFLTKWNLRPKNDWTADVSFERVPTENLEQFLGMSYPVKGLLTGQFHGRGTRAEPTVTGLFDLADATVYGISFNRLRGQLGLSREEGHIANAELRFFSPGKENGRGTGIVTGSASYRFDAQTFSAELVGAGLPLENIQKLQSRPLPVGGQLSFRMKAEGSTLAPTGEGTFRVVDLRVGQSVIGSFEGNLKSDGATAQLELSSAMATGEISGGYTLALAEPHDLNGKISIKNINLDPFLLTALHWQDFSGHANADGDISVHGALLHPESITVDARFPRMAMTYANVQLQNTGVVHFRSSRDSLEIEPVTFQGKDTNLQLGGSVQFAGRRTLALRLNGGLNLRLLSGYVPDLDSRGSAQINASFEGTLDRPRITGRVHVENASARVADFPTGLSAMQGDLVFDANRLYFENVSAESGGGSLHLTGSVNYAETPLRYDVNVRSDRVRIRYPEGMSWLAGGTLRLTGTTSNAVLSGRVIVERVTLTEGLQVAGMLVSAREGISGPSTTSSYLRNLQFEVAAVSAPDARMEWPGAQLRADADLRVRGTWEHPILLGHIHILSGDLNFAGNRYRVSRGDLNFANPFRLDPVLNVEATTTIEQYEITLNFNGPASKLTLAYRSDPPLPADDIITLLALGQTTAESAANRGAGTSSSGTASSGSANASAILSQAVNSKVSGSLERLFGITRFRVDPGLTELGSTGSEQNAAARVTVEQQIAHNLTITYVSNVSSTQQQVIQVEYNVDRNVSVVGLRDQNGTFGIDIKIKKRF